MYLTPDREADKELRAQNVTALKLLPRTDNVVQARIRCGILFFCLLLAWCSTEFSSFADEVTPSEAQVKAAFLLNFPKYVQWPATTFESSNSPIVVGILDSEDVAREFAMMSEAKSIDGHPITVVRITSESQCLRCHILFFDATATRKLPQILAVLRGANVLTVGESDDFLERGGMINLGRRDRRIVLEVNTDAVRQTQLKISSKMMALATVKGGKK